MKKAHSRTSLSNVLSETQKLRRQNANIPSFARRALLSFPRDRWRSCRLNSSNSTGSEGCLEFVIFSQAMVRVTVIHDWVTTFIVVHDRFTTNGYALPVCHVLDHKMDLQRKPQWNLNTKFSQLYYMKKWSKFLQLCIVTAFAYANSRHKNERKYLACALILNQLVTRKKIKSTRKKNKPPTTKTNRLGKNKATRK